MARTQLPKKKVRSAAKKRPATRAKRPQARRAGGRSSLPAEVKGATRRELGGAVIDTGRAGGARVRRVVYPPGFRWSVHMKPAVGSDLCEHAHVGFLAQGEIHIEYPDGCVLELVAPEVVAIEPGHDGWVVGGRPAVLIEVDFERETVDRLGMPATHRHG